MTRVILVTYLLWITTCPLFAMQEPVPALANYIKSEALLSSDTRKKATFRISFIQSWMNNNFRIGEHEIVFEHYDDAGEMYELSFDDAHSLLKEYTIEQGTIIKRFNALLEAITEPIEIAKTIHSTSNTSLDEEARQNAIAAYKKFNSLGKLVLQEDRLIRFLCGDDIDEKDKDSEKIKKNRRLMLTALQEKSISCLRFSKKLTINPDSTNTLSMQDYIEHITELTRKLEL